MMIHEWVAHRGIPARHPDNTLEGLQAALDVGARFVEFDIQLSQDGVPVLMHDANLLRATGVNALIAELTWEQIRAIPLRGGKSGNARIPSLAETVQLLARHPRTIAFAEIKTAALRHGMEQAATAIASVLAPVRAHCVPISFHGGVLRHLRQTDHWPIGWILETWSPGNQRRAQKLAPDYLFANHARIPEGEILFPGPWKWVLYEISDPHLAWQWRQKGADLIETNDLWQMTRSDHPS